MLKKIEPKTKPKFFDIEKLTSTYHSLNYAKKLFFPKKLSELLNKTDFDINQSLLIYQSFFNLEPRVISSFNCLIEFAKATRTKGCLMAYKNGLLTGEEGVKNLTALLNKKYDSFSLEKLECGVLEDPLVRKHLDVFLSEYNSYALKTLYKKKLLWPELVRTHFDLLTDNNFSNLFLLIDNGLLDNKLLREHFAEILNHENFKDLLKCIKKLDEADLLEDEFLYDIIFRIKYKNSNELDSLADNLIKIKNAKLINIPIVRDNLKKLISTKTNIYDITEVLIELNAANLLSGEQAQFNIDDFMSYYSWGRTNLGQALKILNDSGLLNGDQAGIYRKALLAFNDNPTYLAYALDDAHTAGLLNTPELVLNQQCIMAMPYLRDTGPVSLVKILKELNDEQMLAGFQGQANRTFALHALKQGHLYFQTAEILKNLNRANLFNTQERWQANLNNLIEAPTEFYQTVRKFSKYLIDPNSQNYFELLRKHCGLLNNQQIEPFLEHIPEHVMSSLHLGNILAICEREMQHTPEQITASISTYIERSILQGNIPMNNRKTPVLNSAQSTHTASVHTTTDISAWLLQTKYDQKKSVKGIAKLNTWLANASQSAYLSDAQNCMNRLIKEGNHVNLSLSPSKKDSSLKIIEKIEGLPEKIASLKSSLLDSKNVESSITLLDFIGLTILELEEKIAQGALEEQTIIQTLVETLVEIERGYNWNDSLAKDDGGKARAICYGGTANKFCEKLAGTSDLIQFVFINESSIHANLTQLMQEKMVETIQKSYKDRTKQNIQNFTRMIDSLLSTDETGNFCVELFEANRHEFYSKIKQEFEIYEILHGEEAFDKIMNDQVNLILPYIQAIPTANTGANSFFSAATLKQLRPYILFKVLLNSADTLGFNFPEDKPFGTFWEKINEVFNAQLDKIGIPYPDEEELNQLQKSTYLAVKKEKLEPRFSIFANERTPSPKTGYESSPTHRFQN